MHSLKLQVVAHCAWLASALGDMTRLKKSVEVVHRQLADAQLALCAGDGEHDENRHRIGIQDQWRGVFEALPHSGPSHMIDHTSIVDLDLDFLRQDVDCDVDVYLLAIFIAVRDLTAGLHSVTSNVVETHSSMLPQDVSPIPKHLHGLLAVLASEPSSTMFSNPLGPSDSLPPSQRVI